MKKVLYVFTLLILGLAISFSLNNINNTKEDVNTSPQKTATVTTNSDLIKKEISDDHAKSDLECSTCHACLYPTAEDPCLIVCPREQITIHHAPEEGPTVIKIEKLADRYGPVVFSHKVHAQMSEMSGGCDACHHYNTAGPVLACKKCHEPRATRENLAIPDLEAAYHRQCVQCHRQWNQNTGCYSCHLPKESGNSEIEELIKRYHEIEHPEVNHPKKLVYETKADTGRLVTFYHDQHVQMFNVPCKSCHTEESCIECHDLRKEVTYQADQHKKMHKSFEDHHKPCSTCHDNNDCNKCHRETELPPFDHDKSTNFKLGKYHTMLNCNKCHADNKFSKLNTGCTSCHKNFKLGVFNHSKTGLTLTGEHKDFDCENCHTNLNKPMQIKCDDCHDEEITYPRKLPGVNK